MTEQPAAADETSWEPKAPADPVVVGDLIDRVLGRIARGSPGAVLALRAAWRDVAGVRLADRSAPVSLEAGVLTVEVDDGGTASLLRFETANLIRRAADVCVEPVSSVSFRVKRNRG